MYWVFTVSPGVMGYYLSVCVHCALSLYVVSDSSATYSVAASYLISELSWRAPSTVHCTLPPPPPPPPPPLQPNAGHFISKSVQTFKLKIEKGLQGFSCL